MHVFRLNGSCWTKFQSGGRNFTSCVSTLSHICFRSLSQHHGYRRVGQHWKRETGYNKVKGAHEWRLLQGRKKHLAITVSLKSVLTGNWGHFVAVEVCPLNRSALGKRYCDVSSRHAIYVSDKVTSPHGMEWSTGSFETCRHFSHSKEVKRVLHTLQYYVHALNRNFVTFFTITLVRNCDSLLNGSCLLKSVIAGVRQMNSRTFYNP